MVFYYLIYKSSLNMFNLVEMIYFAYLATATGDLGSVSSTMDPTIITKL